MTPTLLTLDAASAAVLPASALAVGASYALRLRRAGAARFARVERMGGSALLGKGAMEATYWALQPVGRLLVGAGVGANAVTYASLVTGVAGGVALGAGMFGVAALLTCVSSLCDAVDGLVARMSSTSSDAGEVLDAAVDRYVEFFFLGGLAYYYRTTPWCMALTLLALLGSFMVSYSTAKAEALGVEAPRGAMRRPERAVYLTVGAFVTALVAAAAMRFDWPAAAAAWPMPVALGVVALVANVSAVRRLAAVAASVRRAALPAVIAAPVVAPPVVARASSRREVACEAPIG